MRRTDNRILELGDTRLHNGLKYRIIGIWEELQEVKLLRWGFDPEEDESIVTVSQEEASELDLLWRFDEQPPEEEQEAGESGSLV